MQTPPSTVQEWFDVFDFTRTGNVSIREVESIMKLMLLKVEPSVLYPIVTSVNPGGMYTLMDVLAIYEQMQLTTRPPTPLQLVDCLRQYPCEHEVLTKRDLDHLQRIFVGGELSELPLDWSSLTAPPAIASQLASIVPSK